MKDRTAAERQRRYRQRALKDPNGLLLTRVQVYLSAQASAALDRLVAERGCTKRQVIESLLIAADRATAAASDTPYVTV